MPKVNLDEKLLELQVVFDEETGFFKIELFSKYQDELQEDEKKEIQDLLLKIGDKYFKVFQKVLDRYDGKGLN